MIFLIVNFIFDDKLFVIISIIRIYYIYDTRNVLLLRTITKLYFITNFSIGIACTSTAPSMLNSKPSGHSLSLVTTTRINFNGTARLKLEVRVNDQCDCWTPSRMLKWVSRTRVGMLIVAVFIGVGRRWCLVKYI